MVTIYQDANDKHIAAKVFFGNTTDDKLYDDAGFTTQTTTAVATDAFLKGVLVVKVGTAFCAATKVDGDAVTADGNTFATEA